ncbi:MAG: hypothetical protein ABJB39_09645 [Chloroflexota bacterium]
MPRPANSPSTLTLAALAVALFWAVEGIDVNEPQVERVLILVVAIALGWLALRASWLAAGFTGYLAILVAISERLRREPLLDGSDVLRATSEALSIVSQGGNPYSSFLQSTVPPGSPFVYPPGELAWYALPQWLLGDITRVDSWAGVLIVTALVIAGLRLGFEAVSLPAMLYAAWGIAGFRAIDGSNDVSASALVVFACVALVFATGPGATAPGHAPRSAALSARSYDIALLVSAVLFGWAIAFKQFSVLLLPIVIRWIATQGLPWRRYALVSLGVAAAFVLPFFVRDPGAFLGAQAAVLTFHQEIWGTNLLNTLKRYGDPEMLVPLFTAVELFGTLALVIVASFRWRPPTLGAALLAGAGIVMVALLFAKWTTQPYYAYVGGIVACGLALLTTSHRDSARPSEMSASD